MSKKIIRIPKLQLSKFCKPLLLYRARHDSSALSNPLEIETAIVASKSMDSIGERAIELIQWRSGKLHRITLGFCNDDVLSGKMKKEDSYRPPQFTSRHMIMTRDYIQHSPAKRVYLYSYMVNLHGFKVQNIIYHVKDKGVCMFQAEPSGPMVNVEEIVLGSENEWISFFKMLKKRKDLEEVTAKSEEIAEDTVITRPEVERDLVSTHSTYSGIRLE